MAVRSGPPPAERPRVRVLYHYFPPDDTVSARHFGDLCEELARRGWDVEARPSNRGCRDERQSFPARQWWRGVTVRRVWRPGLRQASSVGRIANGAWLIARWSLDALSPRGRVPDVLVVGTDPILSVLVAVVWKLRRPQVRIAHWAFDLYPEAAIADGLLDERSLVVRTLLRWLRRAYARCDLIADLGPCMREQLERYDSPARRLTLVPWALAEPDLLPPSDPAARRELFGEASLGLLYSGNLGRAHSFEPFLDLARDLRPHAMHLTFGVRGNRIEELRRAIESAGDTNVSIAGFAPEAALATRLAAADIHLASLRAGWTGTVVPSKFFGSLAVGRPVLFAGPPDSAIARWIRELGVGWVLDDASRARVCDELRCLARDPDRLRALQEHCFGVYRERFSKRAITAAWDRELRACLDGARLTNP